MASIEVSTDVPRGEPLKTAEAVSIFSPKSVESWLSVLRSESTTMEEFRRNADYISLVLGSYLAESLTTVPQQITTPVGETQTQVVDGRGVLLVGVLRSAEPMCRGIRLAMPGAQIAYIDAKRDEETAIASEFYNGLPDSVANYGRIIIPDPMLATGGTARMTIEMLRERGATNIECVAIVAAPEGIMKIQQAYPTIPITTCALDKELNPRKYIVPGLGDFGDRYFGNSGLVIIDELNNKQLIYENGRFVKAEDR